MVDRPAGEQLRITGIAGGRGGALPARDNSNISIPPRSGTGGAAADDGDTDIGLKLAAGLPGHDNCRVSGGSFRGQDKTALEARLESTE